MIAERTKALAKERTTRVPSVQQISDKMSRLINRRPHTNPKQLLNELTSAGGSGEKAVTFNTSSNNNHSTSTKPSSEGKKRISNSTSRTPQAVTQNFVAYV